MSYAFDSKDQTEDTFAQYVDSSPSPSPRHLHRHRLGTRPAPRRPVRIGVSKDTLISQRDINSKFEGDEGIPGIGGCCRGELEPGWCRQSFVGLRFEGAALGGGAPRDQLPR